MQSQSPSSSKTIEYCYSAPAKFILSGEHSVVYGKDALVATIDLRTRVHCQIILKDKDNEESINLLGVRLVQMNKDFELKKNSFIRIISGQSYEWNTIQSFFSKFEEILKEEMPDINENNLASEEKIQFFYILLHSLQYILNLKQNYLKHIPEIVQAVQAVHLKVIVDSELPISKGVGSSASYSVSVAASFLKFWENLFKEFIPNGLSLDFHHEDNFKTHTNQIAFDIEKIFHSTPSGVDNSAITYGGILSYNRVEQRRKQIDGSFLGNFEIILIDSGVEKNTKKTVQMVREMIEKEDISFATKSTINTIGDITKSIEKLLVQGAACVNSDTKESFKQLIKMNHYLLKALNLTNKQLDQIIQICESYSFAGKLTGGGNGGYCVSFIPKTESQENINSFLDTLKINGFETLRLKFAEFGLLSEKFNESI